MAKVEITNLGFETLYILEHYMAEFISDPASLSEQLIDIAAHKLAEHPESCQVCPELEYIGVFDYLQLKIDNDYNFSTDMTNKSIQYLLPHLCEPSKVLRNF